MDTMEITVTLSVLGVDKEFRVSAVSPSCEKNCCVLEDTLCCKPGAKCSSGYILSLDKEGILHGTECINRVKAVNLRRLRNAGLGERTLDYTFENYNTPKPWNATVKGRALAYTEDWRHNSFFISGQSGSGKTHICTAICHALSEKGISPRYFQWTKEGGHFKGIINDREQYEAEIAKYQNADLLYIDDFFKQEVSAADIRLAYELINARYNANRPVIISTERTLQYIMDLRDGDGHAIAGRLKEMCGDNYTLNITGEDKDYRLYRPDDVIRY